MMGRGLAGVLAELNVAPARVEVNAAGGPRALDTRETGSVQSSLLRRLRKLGRFSPRDFGRHHPRHSMRTEFKVSGLALVAGVLLTLVSARAEAQDGFDFSEDETWDFSDETAPAPSATPSTPPPAPAAPV